MGSIAWARAGPGPGTGPGTGPGPGTGTGTGTGACNVSRSTRAVRRCGTRRIDLIHVDGLPDGLLRLVVHGVGGRDVELRVRASVGSVFMLHTVGTNRGTPRRSV